MVDQLESEVIAIIKNRVELESGDGGTAALIVSDLTLATELTSLGVDSLGLADIIWDLEQTYGIRIEMNTAEAWADLQNVGDIVAAIRGLLTKEA
ncbi:acyl carrier protein [Sinorhizobium meliloti]|uniref:acyl carrier protein n=1 Tax=Rhizobium meliloti TaxID=382 RepID=UPI000FD8E6D6|nr:acyl carrier protein [Sinorhizobium meliloti]RVP08801.1 acyl carrier protein [Sinorhizobium meliloti]